MGKLNRSIKAFLFPKDRHTSSETDMSKQIVMANKDFFCLNEVSCIEVYVNTSRTKPGSGHVFASATDNAVVECEIIILAEYLFDMSLDNGYPPALVYSIVIKHLKHMIIPKIFFLR